jgi:hypothetical protein
MGMIVINREADEERKACTSSSTRGVEETHIAIEGESRERERERERAGRWRTSLVSEASKASSKMKELVSMIFVRSTCWNAGHRGRESDRRNEHGQGQR